jgi:hypothetical protein
MAIEETEYSYSYEYGMDILIPPTSGTGPGQFQPFRFPTGLTVTVDPVTKDAATYDDLGAPHEVKLSESWTGSGSLQGHRLSDGKYLPEVEALLALTKPNAVGKTAIGTFRWYDKPQDGTPNPSDAYEGDATVKMTRGETGNDGIASWNFELKGVGRRRQIENPFTGWAVTP